MSTYALQTQKAWTSRSVHSQAKEHTDVHAQTWKSVSIREAARRQHEPKLWSTRAPELKCLAQLSRKFLLLTAYFGRHGRGQERIHRLHDHSNLVHQSGSSLRRLAKTLSGWGIWVLWFVGGHDKGERGHVLCVTKVEVLSFGYRHIAEMALLTSCPSVCNRHCDDGISDRTTS